MWRVTRNETLCNYLVLELFWLGVGNSKRQIVWGVVCTVYLINYIICKFSDTFRTRKNSEGDIDEPSADFQLINYAPTGSPRFAAMEQPTHADSKQQKFNNDSDTTDSAGSGVQLRSAFCFKHALILKIVFVYYLFGFVLQWQVFWTERLWMTCCYSHYVHLHVILKIEACWSLNSEHTNV